MSRHRDYVPGSDGLPARDSGEWGKTKLDFLNTFGPPALDATVRKMTRCYLDMFAGPGLNVGRTTREEFFGSPLRALDLVGAKSGVSFTDAYFVNQCDIAHGALEQRVDRRYASAPQAIPRRRVRTICGDANAELQGILNQIHPKSYLFVFADPDAPSDLPWSSVEALKRHANHESVDLYVLFPLDMALRRLIDYSGPVNDASARVLTEFYGSDAWRQCERFRQSNSLRRDFGECLEEVYLDRLRTLWKYADRVCDVRRESGQGMYKMLFASDHDAAKKIAAWAKKTSRRDADSRTGQAVLDLGGD